MKRLGIRRLSSRIHRLETSFLMQHLAGARSHTQGRQDYSGGWS